MPEDLGCTTSIDVITRLVSLEGTFVLDVGCGDMTFSRELAANGARVLAVDPDPAQAALNRAGDPIPGVEFVEARAEVLPVDSGSVDGVFFSYSLHHVPASAYAGAFAEVRRVLKPAGYLCVIEPTACPLNDVMKLFHDEDEVRASAQEALTRLAVPAFESHAVYTYSSHIEYASFDEFARVVGGRTYNDGHTEADVRRPEVEAAFERAGGPGYRFVSPKTMMLLRHPRPVGQRRSPSPSTAP